MIKLIALFFVLISPAAWAATSEGYGMGGWMYKLQPVIDKANASGELFRIVGHCQSACTTFLGIRNVCIERNATLLFHAGHDDKWQISSYWTERIMSAYNPRLRDYLTRGHYMETLSFHAVPGAVMIDTFGYKECPRGAVVRPAQGPASAGRRDEQAFVGGETPFFGRSSNGGFW